MRRALALALLASLLAGCGQAASPLAPAPRTGVLAARSEAAPSYPAPRFSSNETQVHYDMATFEAMEQLLSRAQRSIRLDYYIFGGPTAERLADLMIAKHKAGVKVQILLDSALGSIPELKRQCLPLYERLRAAGVDVAFHPVKPIPPKTRGRTIDHNKYFVVDGASALLGSMNLSKKFYRYHDMMIEVHGPLAVDLEAQFAFDWHHATHPEAPAPTRVVEAEPATFAAPGPDGPSAVRLVGTGLGRQTGISALLPLLERAKSSIHIQMHEIGDMRVLTALTAARDRGVDVRVLLDPGDIDAFVPVIRKAPKGIINAVALDWMLDRKLNVRTFQVDDRFEATHMKAAVIDRTVLFAGSTNWTQGGFEWVSETNLEIHGGRAPAQAQAQFDHDWVQRGVPAEPPSALALALGKLYHRM